MKLEIEQHYHKDNLYEKILKKLSEQQSNLKNITRKDIASVDEFHVRGEEVTRELANTANVNYSKVLDIGCGIGGPCRLLADEFNCSVTGIDLSEEYIKTAISLSKLVGLSNATNFIKADASNLPFNNNYFDVVWTQHLLVNISNRDKLFREIERVLTNNGTFVYYDIFKKGNKKIRYPMPWAKESKISFVEYTSEMDITLNRLGFMKIESTDQTQVGIKFFEKLLKRIAKHGIPEMGLSILMGDYFFEKISNFLDALKKESIILESGVYKKQIIQ
ncbi:class I SAM-dependent methyltransferase [Marinifilum sp. RC60d5]|uniref:class I SAM-dependent methyltransferase n=1 Tax=Marinifilum sp. RC60d5 TaxID=3458414 RepID=UPI00403507D8